MDSLVRHFVDPKSSDKVFCGRSMGNKFVIGGAKFMDMCKACEKSQLGRAAIEIDEKRAGVLPVREDEL